MCHGRDTCGAALHPTKRGEGLVLPTICFKPASRPVPPQVVTTPDRLTIGLKWYGRVVDGQLHLWVKPSETHWCLEDREVSSWCSGCWHGRC